MIEEICITHALTAAGGFIAPVAGLLVGWNKLKDMITSDCVKPKDLEDLDAKIEKHIRESIEDISEYIRIIDGKGQVNAKGIAKINGKLDID